jgi:hypothetical protein
MKNFVPSLALAAVIACLPQVLPAQDDLQIFGSVQSFFMHQGINANAKLELFNPSTGRDTTIEIDEGETKSSFVLQQLDIFLQKDLGDKFSFFADIEFQRNFNSQFAWGSLSIQEAWLNYEFMPEMELKAGLLFPTFSNLNDIRNRLAVLPYLYRPLIYERTLSSVFPLEDFTPQQAFLQASGNIAIGERHYLDYAVYVGNAEGSYLATDIGRGSAPRDTASPSGFDETGLNFKLAGLRIGLHNADESIKIGYSLTRDYDNNRDSTNAIVRDSAGNPSVQRFLFGDILRYRMAIDALVKIGNFRFNTEFLTNMYLSDELERVGARRSNDFITVGVHYYPESDMTLYAEYQAIRNNFFVTSYASVVSVGYAYRVSDAVTLKAQYVRYGEFFEEQSETSNLIRQFEQDVSVNFLLLGFNLVF